MPRGIEVQCGLDRISPIAAYNRAAEYHIIAIARRGG